MAIKFERVSAGDVLLDVHRERAGNTTFSRWGCWKVTILQISHDEDWAIVSWNGNKPEMWRRHRVERLYTKPPKAYRDQQKKGGLLW